MDIAVRVAPAIDTALEHIRTHSTQHTEAIVTDSLKASRYFVSRVDAAAVMVNASTRFTDGGEFGFGAEIGISNQKLHARGPMCLLKLIAAQYVVTGGGELRQMSCVPWQTRWPREGWIVVHFADGCSFPVCFSVNRRETCTEVNILWRCIHKPTQEGYFRGDALRC